MWYSLISCLFCLAAGILASWAAGFEEPERVNPVLISPPVASLFRRWGLGVGEEYVKKIQILNAFNFQVMW